MRPFFVFLALLLWLIPIRAAEQLVIKDSEAIRYVGRYVEVCGLVVSVTTSPLGTAFINFGREYPNQTFAGFVPADSGMNFLLANIPAMATGPMIGKNRARKMTKPVLIFQKILLEVSPA